MALIDFRLRASGEDADLACDRCERLVESWIGDDFTLQTVVIVASRHDAEVHCDEWAVPA